MEQYCFRLIFPPCFFPVRYFPLVENSSRSTLKQHRSRHAAPGWRVTSQLHQPPLSLSLSLMRFRVFSLAIATGYIRRGKNTRRKRLTSFSREIGILRTVIERHLEGAEGNSNNRFSVETRGFLLGDARKYIARSCVLIRSLLSFSRLTLPKR